MHSYVRLQSYSVYLASTCKQEDLVELNRTICTSLLNTPMIYVIVGLTQQFYTIFLGLLFHCKIFDKLALHMVT